MPEFNEGDSASLTKTITDADIRAFAEVTGDSNPVHVDEEYAANTRFGQRIAHGMLTASFISAVIGTKLPGPGAIYLGQTLQFRTPAYLGDTVTATCTIQSYDKKRGRMTLSTVVRNQQDEEVVSGEATVHYRP